MIDRVFLGWDEPVLPAAARWLADRSGGPEALDLRATVLAVPGSRAGRRLKELLLDESIRRGLRLAPPRVVTVGMLSELFYQPDRPPAPPLVVRRTWTAALLAAESRGLQEVFGALPERGDERGWDRLGSQVASLHHDVAGGGHRFVDVARVCAGGDLGFDDGARWGVLAEAQRAYADLLARLGFTDPDLARIDAGTSLPLAADSEVVLVGVAELTPAVARIVAGATSAVTALIHAPAEAAYAFDAVGGVIPDAWVARRIPLEPEHLRVADRPAGQAAEALRAIAGLDEEQRGEVVVATADEKLVPYLEEWLSAAGLTTHNAAGRAIDQSAPYRLLEAVAAYLERPQWEEFAALVRHPDLESRLRREAAAGDEERVTIGAVDRYFMDHLPATLGGELPRPTGAVGELQRRLHQPELLGQFAKPRRLNQWASAAIGLLNSIYGNLPADSTAPSLQKTVDVLEALRDAAVALHRLPPELAPTTSAAFAIRLILDQVAGRSIAEEPDQEAVELLGWLELASDDAPFVVVAGVNEGTLPESRSADPFLPDRLRTRLGLLDNARRYARDAFLLTGLLHSRKSLRLVSGRMTGEGDPLRPSRLTLTSPGVNLAKAVLAFSNARAGAVQPPLLARAGERSEFQLPPVPRIELDPPLELPVTAFAGLLRDPFRWALESRLRLARRDDAARELDALHFGTLAHRVLRRFGRAPEAGETNPDLISAALGRILAEEAHALFGDSSFPAVRLQVEQLRLRLARFAHWQAGWIAEGWETILVEGGPLGMDEPDEEGARALFEVDEEPIVLKGRIDRVDRHPATGRVAILDYKTSEEPLTPDEAHRTKRTREWQDLQLPLYRHILAATVGANGSSLVAAGAPTLFGYVLLCRDAERIGVELAEWTPDELVAADEVARAVVRQVRSGTFVYDEAAVHSWNGDPLAPLLGLRQLVAAEAEAEAEAEGGGAGEGSA